MKFTSKTALATPVGFGKFFLGFNYYKWQERVLWDIFLGKKPVSLAAANGSGKTSLVACTLVAWHAAVRPNSQTVTTAGVYRQVEEQLWAALNSLKDKFGPEWKVNATELKAPNGAMAIGFSTEDPNKFEGWHGGKSGSLLLIFDEAKSIPDGIFEASKRCNAPEKRVLLMSSTGKKEGEFYASHTKKRHLYSCHKITAYDCPHIKEDEINALIDEYGREHPLVQSTIFSNFVELDGESTILTQAALDHCRNSPPAHIRGHKWAFIDWAAGGDECVVAILDGNKLLPLICWRDTDTMRSVGRAIMELRENQVPQGNIFADGDGLGIPMNRRMAELGMAVTPIHNGKAAHNKAHYGCRGAEIWYRAAEMVQKCKVILPDDPKMDSQLSTRRQWITNDGRLDYESKAEMKSRGVESPDRGDAMCGVIGLVLNKIQLTAFQDRNSYSANSKYDLDEEEARSGGLEGDFQRLYL